MASEKKSNYHHGDLRSALVEQGLKLLEAREGDDLGLREVARAVGVSATAVYRHFPDKAALLRALAAEGLSRLAKAQRDAFAAATEGERFAATGRAYVRFALANPALFRLMFANPPEDGAARNEEPEAFRLLLENAAVLAPAGADPETVRFAALGVWARVHGLALLMLDGQVEADPRLIDAVITPLAPVR